ncbi:MAG: bifunctional phosphopantothenoylcysteine decarboxylase/phosphopantothenate--cysteine ligase CoaBC, partial [Candidatus Aerophobetes bacterium]|nr:bifunctional phosphopantothenoylcysteine decarboxylase/phosphopantothenate--cysteine ligase CoaBC [Candidatus Aerophobetes bacterium]
LKKFGFKFIGPEEGRLASGETGTGRISEPSKIVEYVEKVIKSKEDFKGKSFLVTAGPTRERLDRVRFISNYSSGKMGYALAEEGIARGAKIILISGPSSLAPPPKVEFHSVESAEEMGREIKRRLAEVDGVLMAAAVSDYRPFRIEEGKIKKNLEEKINLKLIRNADILKEIGKKKENKVLVGFCAEVENLENEARAKLKEKNLDLIAANSINLKGSGFGVDTNIVTLIDNKGNVDHFPRMSKREVAEKVWDKIREIIDV